MIKIRLKPLKEGKKSPNKPKKAAFSLREMATEEELEHIGAARLLEPQDLAFSGIFGDKRRIIIDFEQFSDETEIGKFVNMFHKMGYTVDWDKGTLSGAREMRDTNPASLAQAIMSGGSVPAQPRKIHMKIGKWLKKAGGYAIKLADLTDKIMEHHQGDIDYDRITGNHVKTALTEQEVEAYYRNMSLFDMMTGDMATYFRNRPYELQNWGSWWQTNAGSIKREIADSFHNDDDVIITRHPIDVFRMSDFENIRSCHSPPSREGHMTQQYKCAVAEAHGHGAVAYVVDKQELLEEYGVNTLEEVEEQESFQGPDEEIFFDDERPTTSGPLAPKYRVRLRQMRYYDDDDALNASIGQGTEIAVPERRMYPEGLPGFVERILKWAREEQQDVMAGVPREGDALNMGRFIKFGGSYEDNAAPLLLADLFADQFGAFVGNPIQDTDTEDELESALTLDMVKSVNGEIKEYEARYNESFQYMRVNGNAFDDGETVGIDMEARIRFEWPVSEWKSLPDRSDMRYCVEELKDSGKALREIEGVHTSDYLISGRSTIIQIGDEIIAHIPIDPEIFSGQEKYMEYITSGAEGFALFCQSLRGFDKMKAAAIKQYVDTYFKREGNIEGGGMITLGRAIENGEYRWTEWGTEASGNYYEGYDSITAEMTVAIPNIGEVRLPEDMGTQRFSHWVMENIRPINIELRKRIMAGPREGVGTEYYIPSRIISANTNEARNELYVKWELELPYDANDEMVALMIETISEVTEEEVTETLEAIIKQLLQEQHLSETKKRGADWALKQWKNNFI